MTEWVEVRFGDLLKEPVRNGLYKPKEFHGRGASIVNMGELFAYPRLGRVPMRRVEVSTDEIRRFGVQPGDLLFARRSLVAEGAGRCCYVVDTEQPTVFESSLIRARPDPMRGDPGFLYYLFQSPAGLHLLDTIRRQVAVAGITGSDLSNLRIRLPPIGAQRRIANILGALDDRVELNHQMGTNEEELAGTLFRAWFLVRDAEHQWPVAALGHHLEVTRGLSYKGDGLSASGTPLHNLNSIREGGGYKPEGIKWYAGEFAERHVVRAGDLIVTNTEQGHDRQLIGHAAVVPVDFGPDGLYSHHLYRVRVKPGSPLTPEFVCHLLNSREMHEIVSGYSNGTTVQMLPAEALLRPTVAVPPAETVQRFTALASLARQRQGARRSQSANLIAIRNALLPRLLSGGLEAPA